MNKERIYAYVVLEAWDDRPSITDSTITVFDNREASEAYIEYLKETHRDNKIVYSEVVPIYTHFQNKTIC